MSKPKLAFIVNTDWFFVSHRLSLAEVAIAAGFDVHLITNVSNKESVIKQAGVNLHHLPISRKGTNPFSELGTVVRLAKILASIQPNILHLVTPKGVIYGGVLAKFLPKSKVVAAISGLGSVFSDTQGSGLLMRAVVSTLYRVALSGRSTQVIFQNSDDQREISRLVNIPPHNSHLIRGSGVPLNRYQFLPEPDGVVTVTFASRLLWEKGIGEFIKAANQLAGLGVRARWIVSGQFDQGNPTAITEEEFRALDVNGVIEYVGYSEDIPNLFRESHVIVLPSYYKEGIPRVLLEAAACGRPVVTTDMPGCREAIEPGITGEVIPARDVSSLADVIQKLIESPQMRQEMGKRGRELAEREFDVDLVAARHLEIYRKLSAY